MQRKLPAYPIFVKDPNFSLWMTADELNKTDITNWCGEKKPIYGIAKLSDGTAWCFLGDISKIDANNVQNAKQTDLTVTSFETVYSFDLGGTALRVRFVSPLPPDDVERISQPVCYMSYEIDDENAEVSLFVNRRIAYNYSDLRLPPNNICRNYSYRLGDSQVAFVGLKRQLYLSNNEDWFGADWGYWYLCGQTAAALDGYDFARYLACGDKNFSNFGEEKYIAAFCKGKSGSIELAYDSIVAIDYFGDFKKSLYLEKHTVLDAIADVRANRAKIEAHLDEIDKKLKAAADEICAGYYEVLVASLRQSVAAHTAIRDNDGNVVFLSKENGSNGCIGTLDVSYPGMPLYLLFDAELVRATLRPIVKFARMPVWPFDFTPHDVGAYPHCCGNVYGAYEKGKFETLAKVRCGQLQPQYYLFPESNNEFDESLQMPVEECANILIMLAACHAIDGDATMFADNIDLCRKWVEYLVNYGLKPSNQLCSDDFAGHFTNNLNLAVKATVGIGCYARLLQAIGKDGNEYMQIAKRFASEIEEFADNFTHLPLTWDSGEDTFGIKYNLLFDKVLSLGLFSQALLEKETDFYITKLLRFGVPFFDKDVYVKSDWAVWCAALTDDKQKREKMIAPIVDFLQNTNDRVPFSDWYSGTTGKHNFMQARSVVGGCFAILLTHCKKV